MKKLTKATTFLIMIIILSVALLGCNTNVLHYNTDYTEYYFDSTQNRFIKTGRNLYLNENKLSFTMKFANDTSVTGALVVEEDINGLVLSVADEAFAPFKTNYSEYLSQEYGEIYSTETIQAMLDQINIMEQLYYNKNHIFSSRSMQLIKAISEEDENVNYSNFEGLYDSVKDADMQYLFTNGKLYTVIDGVTSEKAYGTYTVNENYVTVIRTDEDGEPIYKEGELVKLSYLNTTISYPDDFTLTSNVDDEDYNSFVEDAASLLAGKTISVLVNSFYIVE